MGQKQTFQDTFLMSAFPQKADMFSAETDVR